jgi:hypothetical protein
MLIFWVLPVLAGRRALRNEIGRAKGAYFPYQVGPVLLFYGDKMRWPVVAMNLWKSC